MKHSALVFTVFLGMLGGSEASADARVDVCGKDVWPGDPRTDLSEALQIGGRITFACVGTIGFTRSHSLTRDMAIDGNGGVTLVGQGHRMFGMGSSLNPRISFKAIRIEGGGVGPSGKPGGVISGEGRVALLEGTSISNSQQPIWILAGSLDVLNARLDGNTGPVIVVSEGTLDISHGTLTDNTGLAIATGPRTRSKIADTQLFRNGGLNFGGTKAQDCEVTITKTWFADNVVAEDGGALYSRCKTTIEDTQFERNRAGRDGGAIYLGIGASASMRVVRFKENRAAGSGGAVAGLWDINRQGSLRIRHGRFEGNQAGIVGGAIIAGESSMVELGASTFVDNIATNSGGAVYVRQSPLVVSGSLFLRNRAKIGGAIKSLCMPAAAGRIANSIIANNVATYGGAYYGTHMTFLNATLVGNGGLPVHQGVACSDTSAIAFANTIIDGGWSGGCAGGDADLTFKDLGHNLQFPGQSCGPTIAVAPPLLGLFFAPFRPFSPAGSAGDNALCRAPPINGRDFFGAHRPQGSACSIGAVEGDLSQLIDRFIDRQRGDRG